MYSLNYFITHVCVCVCVCVQSLNTSVDKKPKAWSTPPSGPSYDNSGEASRLPFRGSVQGRTKRRATASHEEGPGRGGFMAMAPVDRQRAHNEQYGEPGTNRTAARQQLHGYLANCTTGMFQTSMLNGVPARGCRQEIVLGTMPTAIPTAIAATDTEPDTGEEPSTPVLTRTGTCKKCGQDNRQIRRQHGQQFCEGCPATPESIVPSSTAPPPHRPTPGNDAGLIAIGSSDRGSVKFYWATKDGAAHRINDRKYQALVLWPVSDHTSPDPRNEMRASRSMVTCQSVRIDHLTTMQKRAAAIIKSHAG